MSPPEGGPIADDWLPVLEALADERLGGLPAGEVPGELAAFVEEEDGVARLAGARRAEVLASLEDASRSRRVEWVGRSVDQGEVLDAFARHCREELDEIAVLAAEPTRLTLSWRRERATIELRAGTVACERLAGEDPVLLLTPLSRACVARLADDQRLAARLAICDLVRLEKINAVRSSVFVYFEWFLRDAYGVKLLTAAEFTRALVARGVLSLGMG
jgi:hypothetical protein